MADPRGLCPLSGLQRIAELLKAGLDADACEMGLFNNSLVITGDAVVGDFQEPTYPGYSRLPVDPWTVAVGGSYKFKVEQVVGPLFTSTQLTPGPRYLLGSFIVNSAGTLIFAQYLQTFVLEPFVGSARRMHCSLVWGNLNLSVAPPRDAGL